MLSSSITNTTDSMVGCFFSGVHKQIEDDLLQLDTINQNARKVIR
jgi:hypothetical protein